MTPQANWGPKASRIPVKVYYRTKLPDGGLSNVSWSKMSHQEYFKWLNDAAANGHVLQSVEQLRED